MAGAFFVLIICTGFVCSSDFGLCMCHAGVCVYMCVLSLSLKYISSLASRLRPFDFCFF